MICSPPGACPENWPGSAYLSHTHKLQVQSLVLCTQMGGRKPWGFAQACAVRLSMDYSRSL